MNRKLRALLAGCVVFAAATVPRQRISAQNPNRRLNGPCADVVPPVTGRVIGHSEATLRWYGRRQKTSSLALPAASNRHERSRLTLILRTCCHRLEM